MYAGADGAYWRAIELEPFPLVRAGAMVIFIWYI